MSESDNLKIKMEKREILCVFFIEKFLEMYEFLIKSFI